MKTTDPSTHKLLEQLRYLKLNQLAECCETLLSQAAREHWSHGRFLHQALETESLSRRERTIQRRIDKARIPVAKTIDQFNWDWPKTIPQEHVRHLFNLDFVRHKTNVIFMGAVGLGKTHLASALGLTACQATHSVYFTTAIAAINQLLAAQATHRLKAEMLRFTSPQVLIMDEVGYLPLDKAGADLLFQIISERYERGSIVLTTNKAYKHWPSIFQNDSGITSAILDRLLHKADTIVIEGKSYRMKDRVEELVLKE